MFKANFDTVLPSALRPQTSALWHRRRSAAGPPVVEH